jgi:DNA adenine methylase
MGAWALFNASACFGGAADSHSMRWECGKSDASTWQKKIKSLDPFIQRLKFAIILNQDAMKFIKLCDKKGVLLYVDAPYYGTEKYYKCARGFSHVGLCKLLHSLKHAKVVLSHYYAEPYIEMYKDWDIEQQVSRSNIPAYAHRKRVIEALFIKR